MVPAKHRLSSALLEQLMTTTIPRLLVRLAFSPDTTFRQRRLDPVSLQFINAQRGRLIQIVRLPPRVPAARLPATIFRLSPSGRAPIQQISVMLDGQMQIAVLQLHV